MGGKTLLAINKKRKRNKHQRPSAVAACGMKSEPLKMPPSRREKPIAPRETRRRVIF